MTIGITCPCAPSGSRGVPSVPPRSPRTRTPVHPISDLPGLARAPAGPFVKRNMSCDGAESRNGECRITLIPRARRANRIYIRYHYRIYTKLPMSNDFRLKDAAQVCDGNVRVTPIRNCDDAGFLRGTPQQLALAVKCGVPYAKDDSLIRLLLTRSQVSSRSTLRALGAAWPPSFLSSALYNVFYLRSS
jgi:hypothetical protein